jgi:hypothetical protein
MNDLDAIRKWSIWEWLKYCWWAYDEQLFEARWVCCSPRRHEWLLRLQKPFVVPFEALDAWLYERSHEREEE